MNMLILYFTTVFKQKANFIPNLKWCQLKQKISCFYWLWSKVGWIEVEALVFYTWVIGTRAGLASSRAIKITRLKSSTGARKRIVSNGWIRCNFLSLISYLIFSPFLRDHQVWPLLFNICPIGLLMQILVEISFVVMLKIFSDTNLIKIG